MNASKGCSSKEAFKRRVTFTDSITVNFFQENVMNCKKKWTWASFIKSYFQTKQNAMLGTNFFNSANMITTAD